MNRRLPLTLLLTALLSACNPKFDWRDYRSQAAPYGVLFPSKPAQQTRSVQLDRFSVEMHMSAAEIDGVVFAVGSAQLAEAAQVPAALDAMQAAMVRNIGASITRSSRDPLEIDASGRGMRLVGRFLSKDRRVYQVVVIGPEQKIEADAVDTFLSSFKLY